MRCNRWVSAGKTKLPAWLFSLFLFVDFIPHTISAQNRYAVLITEFLTDPSPSVGLPENEFIEVTNCSHVNVNLRNWKISSGSNTASIKPDYILAADSSVILCAAAAAHAFQTFGQTLGLTGFPSLNNESGELVLTTENDKVMHAVRYDQNMFGNAAKAAGGWSLEMIDIANPCSGNNWTASIDASGGTPGKKNSVAAMNPDLQPPALLRCYPVDPVTLTIIFSEPLDSLSGFADNFSFSDLTGPPASIVLTAPLFDRCTIVLPKPMVAEKVYSLRTEHLRDCAGNEMAADNIIRTGLPQKIQFSDIVFNEILFNPPPAGSDYIELYNRSSKIFSCTDLLIAARDASGNLKNPAPVAKENRLLFPDDYLLLTESPDWIIENYPDAPAAALLDVSSLPSMPDDNGTVVLLDPAGTVIDELAYDHHWHLPLTVSENGVALERIQWDKPTNDPANWTSAAGPQHGTPGYQNSEFIPAHPTPDFISLEPKIFSPDMDGYNDFCFILFHLPGPGYRGSIFVYSVDGRMVRLLVNNTSWQTEGSFRWDGLDDQQNPLPIGHYIIYAEIFQVNGSVKKQKLVCTLARK